MLARMVSRRVACVAVIVCLVGAVDAQDDGASLRGRAIGEVRTRENRAWVGAEVVLVSRPVPHAVHLGEEDRVVAVTRRARALLRAGAGESRLYRMGVG